MSTIIEKILSDSNTYSRDVTRLGECKLPSPVRRHEFVNADERILVTENSSVLKTLVDKLGVEPSFERAGPHPKIYHDPNWTRAAILTAGGLCPGLNNVIKGITETLKKIYGVPVVYGIPYGYAGLNPALGHPFCLLCVGYSSQS